MARLVSKIYGEAIFEYAKENSQLEKMCEEAFDIVTVLSQSKELRDFIANPKVSTDEKVAFIRDLFLNKFWAGTVARILKVFNIDITKGQETEILNFLEIIIRKGRQKDIVPILEYFIHRTLQDKNIGEAEVITAHELSDDKKKKLEEKLVASTKYEKFLIDYKVDEDLIAGIKIKIDGKVFDKTYKTKIFDISKSLRGLKYD